MAHFLQRLIAVSCAAAALAQNPAAPASPAAGTRPKLKAFSHETHLKMGNVAPVIAAAIDKGTYPGSAAGDYRKQLNTTNPCLACHHGIEGSNGKLASTFLRMADCIVCHNKTEMPNSCAFCHVEGSNLKPASHTPDFMESHSRKDSKLDMTTCAVCHGKKFTCMGCHLG